MWCVYVCVHDVYVSVCVVFVCVCSVFMYVAVVCGVCVCERWGEWGEERCVTDTTTCCLLTNMF